MKKLFIRLLAVLATFAAISQAPATPLDDFLARRDRLARSFHIFRMNLRHIPPAARAGSWMQWTTLFAPQIVALLRSGAEIVAVTPSPNLGGVGSDGVAAPADDPTWWTNWGALNASYPPNAYAIVNQGRLKSFAAKAIEELDADIAGFGGAGTKLHALVASLTKEDAAQEVNIGELKDIGNLFYSRLVQVGYTGAIPFWLAPNPGTDRIPASIGQLKIVFHFDVTLDADADGFPDWWEMHYFGHLGVDPNADPNGDGETNLQKFLEGADPTMPLPPVLTITRGDGQVGGAGGYVPQVLTVRLTRGQQPAVNAPITFAVTQGGGQVQATRTSAPASTVTVAANAPASPAYFLSCQIPPTPFAKLPRRAASKPPRLQSCSPKPRATALTPCKRRHAASPILEARSTPTAARTSPGKTIPMNRLPSTHAMTTVAGPRWKPSPPVKPPATWPLPQNESRLIAQSCRSS